MLDIKFIRENPESLDHALKTRGIQPLAQQILELDSDLRAAAMQLQELNTERNEIARNIGLCKQQKIDDSSYLQRAAEIKQLTPQLESALIDYESKLQGILEIIPNIPYAEVPIGVDELSNKEVKQFGHPPKFEFSLKSHFEIGETIGKMDFGTASNVSGARFVFLYSELALLERALANFMLDIHTTEHGYMEVSPPLLVKDHAMYGVGQLPKFEEDSFKVSNDYRLIPTAEVSLTNIVADKIIAEEELPLRYTAYTPCFRSEAGSAGRDTRGMIRLHQFSKVELVSITRPKDSTHEHERMLSAAEEILKRLELCYRVMLLSTGDMGFSAHKTYDIEVWLPAQDKFREISSCSNCGDFQARRMKARYKEYATGNNYPVHTLNGSALAVGRTMVAILENYQNSDGSITVPDVLHKYMNGLKIIGGQK
jgi:seryl-tRNA synthetase